MGGYRLFVRIFSNEREAGSRKERCLLWFKKGGVMFVVLSIYIYFNSSSCDFEILHQNSLYLCNPMFGVRVRISHDENDVETERERGGIDYVYYVGNGFSVYKRCKN
jgi:hypothetical protein